MSRERISTGVYVIETPCPLCGQIEDAIVRLSSVVTTDEFQTQTLRVKLKGEAIDHNCNVRQTTLAELAEKTVSTFSEHGVTSIGIRTSPKDSA